MTFQTALKSSELDSTGVPNEVAGISTLPLRQRGESSAITRQKVVNGAIEASNKIPFDTSTSDDIASPTFPRMRFKSATERASQFELLAEWDGCVTAFDSDNFYFSATLKGKRGEGVQGEEEEASIPVDDVSDGDRELLRLGNFFRLCVIHEVLPSGQPRRYTQVVFRRMPSYRRHDIEKAVERGREIARRLRVE